MGDVPADLETMLRRVIREVTGLTPVVPADKWRATAPIISNGRVVVTAFDSNLLECIDLRSGKVLWEMPRQADDLYVGGVVNDRVVVVGKKEIRAYHLTGEDAAKLTPKVAWGRVTIPNPSGAPGRMRTFQKSMRVPIASSAARV